MGSYQDANPRWICAGLKPFFVGWQKITKTTGNLGYEDPDIRHSEATLQVIK